MVLLRRITMDGLGGVGLGGIGCCRIGILVGWGLGG